MEINPAKLTIYFYLQLIYKYHQYYLNFVHKQEKFKEDIIVMIQKRLAYLAQLQIIVQTQIQYFLLISIQATLATLIVSISMLVFIAHNLVYIGIQLQLVHEPKILESFVFKH